jgi:hypothetical protein
MIAGPGSGDLQQRPQRPGHQPDFFGADTVGQKAAAQRTEQITEAEVAQYGTQLRLVEVEFMRDIVGGEG